MKKNLLTAQSHGGDFYRWKKETGLHQKDILDFSVNVRPDGMPDFLKASIFKNIHDLCTYPDPQAEELKELSAKHYGFKPQNFVFGNGSNELLYALAHVLYEENYLHAYILDPAFSEYRFSLEKAHIQTHTLLTVLSPRVQKGNFQLTDKTILAEQKKLTQEIQRAVQNVPDQSIIVLANPANPSGFLIKNEKLSAIIKQKQDCIFVIDEAFIDYTDEKSLLELLPALPENLLILRSLTKFYALAGIRLGCLACHEELAKKIQEKLPAWNVNTLAQSLAKTFFTEHKQAKQDYRKTKQQNEERKTDLYQKLSQIHGISLYASWANYILFSVDCDCPHFWQELLTRHRIAVRNCDNYKGLENKNFYRVAVRFPEEHTTLCQAMQNILHTIPVQPQKKKPALMLLGTSSNAGKSILTAGFCRIFTQDGYTVRPFKAQNMSLNSGVTLQGEELGRAQIVQAKACNTEPDSKMNPVLLKPQTDTGSQIIVRGKAAGTALAREYYQKKNELWDIVTKSYDELADEADIMVLEGAGSPAEINLKENDIVNLKMAEYARASTLLVGDIDRGGVYASFLGSWQTFTKQEDDIFTGFLVNRFRGDSSLLAPAHAYLEKTTGKKVLGIIPYIKDLNLPEEDMAGSLWNRQKVTEQLDYTDKNRKLDIAVIMLGKISNHTDFEPLALERHCLVRPVYTANELGTPDLIILPGSKSVAADLEELRQNGLFDKILALTDTSFILGICGGLQMLGYEILDPLHIESTKEKIMGFGLLDITTEFHKEKQLTLLKNIQTPLDCPIHGYEIHHAKSTEIPSQHNPVMDYFRGENGTVYGYTSRNVWATYVHGLFDDDVFRLRFINHIRTLKGLNLVPSCTPYTLESSLNKLADIIRKNVDMNAIYQSMGLDPKK